MVIDSDKHFVHSNAWRWGYVYRIIRRDGAGIVNTIKNAVAKIAGLVVMTGNLIILANSFKSCKNWKELETVFLFT